MDVIYRIVAGLDIGKKLILACVRRIEEDGKVSKEIRRFGTTTAELRILRDWLLEKGVTHVAMESTGVYWKPIWNVLEGNFELLLVNAQHIKNVPGHKTDVKDCEWIAQCLQYGLVRGSFVAPRVQRDLRDLTRQRQQLIRERASAINRVHKILEDANIKLSSVATDIMGASGIAMLNAMVDGETNPEVLASFAKGKLQKKLDALLKALDGFLTEHHRFMIKLHLKHINAVSILIDEMDNRIKDCIEPFQSTVELLTTHVAIGDRSAQNVISEIGVDMNQFPNDRKISAWAGVSPGVNESAGKHKSAKTLKGNKWLQATLTEISWVCTFKKDSHLQAKYRRIAKRRGKKRAIVALNHANLRIIYHMIKHQVPFSELGADYYIKTRPQRAKQYFIKRLNELGYEVELKKKEDAA